MKIIKKIITYIIALFLTIFILISILVNLLSSTILNENYILSKLEETDYYSQIYELVESNFENYIQQSGLDEDVISGIITEEKIEKDTQQILINLYDGINEEITTQEIEDTLRENIDESLEGRDLTEEEEEAIDTFIQKICNEYKNTILHTDYEEQINNIYQKITNYTNLAKRISIFAIGVFIILLIVINFRRIYRAVDGCAVSLLSSGVILLAVNFYVNSKIKIQSITVLNNAFSSVIRSTVEEIFNNIFNFGCIMTIIGVILIIVSNLVHNIRKYGKDS